MNDEGYKKGSATTGSGVAIAPPQGQELPERGVGSITVRGLPNGYWEATISLPWPLGTHGGQPYVQTASDFHDEQEARDWAEWMIHFLTCTEDCCS